MRFTAKLNCGLVLALFASFPSVQSAGAQPGPGVHTISVSGDAQINVVPDKILITLGVENVDPSLDAAKAANDASCARILATTQRFNINAKDVQTDYISVMPQHTQSSDGVTRIVGYMVRKSIVITLRDITRFDALLSASVGSGANVVLGVRFMTSDLRKYRDQARELAIKAAKDKVDGLAGALGQRAGKAVTINEQQNGFWSSYNNGWDRSYGNGQSQIVYQSAQQGGAGDGGGGETTAPGETQVRATVQVVFQLAD